ncbi:hypothetical protein CYMTET_43149 [Cymbomonas tetramitiformis]|uniref:Uncharacterized protein n=1 Tax=Cymbomonas tetramitiformis TaxID=36881 RepID=A0AAE0C2U9_9CHLO|nr:hypothetical protein CYMTET_43149 [Cymbomonas tetramitiformis]
MQDVICAPGRHTTGICSGFGIGEGIGEIRAKKGTVCLAPFGPSERICMVWLLLLQVKTENNAQDIGPQNLWNALCLKLCPSRRMFIPGGLFCGLREQHVVGELHRMQGTAQGSS